MYERCPMGKMWLLSVWDSERQQWVPHQVSFYRCFVEEIEQRLFDNDVKAQISLVERNPDIFNYR